MRDQNQTLGRGEVHFAPFKPGTIIPDGYRYFGDTGEFNLAVKSEDKPYYSMERGVKRKTKSATVQTDQSGTFTCTDINLDNVAFFFLGSMATITQVAAPAQTETLAAIKLGRSYQLGVTEATPIGVRKLTLNTVETGVGPTPLVEDTDYTFDAERGIITFLDDAANVADDADVDLDYDVGATSYDRAITGEQQVEGALMFLAYNAEGENIDYRMLYVRLSPNGDLSLKGEDWMNMPFTVEILKPANGEAIYANGQPYTA